MPRVAGLYISGTSIGGFCGRFIPGMLTDLIGWRLAFSVVALLTLVAAIIVALTLPRERQFVRSGGLANSLTQMLRHLRDRASSRPTPSASASCSTSSPPSPM